ncbi:ammonia-forming cytochrome c nitrite reductase subunit c552 [bacterium]|nr:ammonia-forming cytochrome c nitrite reductase subunit c552 [bacterium]
MLINFIKHSAVFIFLLLLVFSVTYADDKSENKQMMEKYNHFDNPQVCSGCHWEKFDRWNVSQHSRGFTGDFFSKQFYDIVLPSLAFDEKVKDVHIGCIGCHAPSSFLAGDLIPDKPKKLDNFWNRGDGKKTIADRGVFCDFCHTIDHFKNTPPFNFDYVSRATSGIDAKGGDLEFPWSPYHETVTSEIYESPDICATCHNELNPYGVWVKATEHEFSESVYPKRGIVCQTCHMQHMGGKPAKMGENRPHNSDHWFGGGFTGFVEGAAKVDIVVDDYKMVPGEKISFKVLVHDVATGHKFPTGSVEARDVWLHVGVFDKNDNELYHIKIPNNPNDPDDKYFITSNEKTAYPSHSRLSKPFERDALVEGDRLYHSAFIDSDGNFTYAQWMAVKEIENRLNPLEIREEKYEWKVSVDIKKDEVFLRAVLNYRRMTDSFADYLKIDRRPVIEISRDEVRMTVKK